MKVLWVKSGGLLPLDEGGKIRSFSLVRELSRLEDISIVTFYPAMTPDPHDQLAGTFPCLECLPIDVPDHASLREVMAYAANGITSRPYQMFKYCKPHVAQRLRERLTRDWYDVIICDYVLTAAVLPWDLHLPTVIFTHNVEATIWSRHRSTNRNLIWKLIASREHRAVARFERHFIGLADHVLSVSDTDRNEFLKFLPPEKVSTIPTGVDLDYFRPAESPSRDHALVFTGSLEWNPNEDAMFHFVDAIFPLVQERVPDVTLRIVGRKPSRRLLAMKAKNPAIRVTGSVADIRPYVQNSSVYIVPLRIGSGTRIKIFEAMAMGVPVVSTRVGAEGLPVTHGENILLADRPTEFADRTVELLLQAPMRERISKRARALVEGRYSWTAAAEVFDRVLHQVVQPGQRVAAHA